MDPQQIETAIGAADLPSLLAALAYATDDPGLVPVELWLDPSRALEPNGGWDDDQLARARELAVSGLGRLTASGAGSRRGPDDALVPSLIDWLTGADLDDGYRRMLAEELAVTGDLRVPELITDGAWPPDGAVDHPVAVIGAGDVGHPGRPPPQAGRHRLRRARQERRCGRNLAGEHLSGLPGGRVQPRVQLLRRAARRLARVPLQPASSARLLPRLRPTVGDRRPDPLRVQGRVPHLGRRCPPLEPAPPDCHRR